MNSLWCFLIIRIMKSNKKSWKFLLCLVEFQLKLYIKQCQVISVFNNLVIVMREWTSSQYRGVEYEFTLFFSNIRHSHSALFEKFRSWIQAYWILSLLGKHVWGWNEPSFSPPLAEQPSREFNEFIISSLCYWPTTESLQNCLDETHSHACIQDTIEWFHEFFFYIFIHQNNIA